MEENSATVEKPELVTSSAPKQWKPNMSTAAIGFLSTITICLLLAYTIVSIQQTKQLVEVVEDRFGDVIVTDRANGLIVTDFLVFSVAYGFIITWICLDELCYLLIALGPICITWSLLMATLLSTFRSTEVNDDFSSKGLYCNEIQMDILAIPRGTNISFDPTTRAIFLKGLGIDQSLCTVGIIIAFVALTCVKLQIGIIIYVIKYKLEQNIEEGNFSCKSMGCKMVISCNLTEKEKEIAKNQEVDIENNIRDDKSTPLTMATA